jgi:nucleoside-diphosphate-sugar epimerase
VLDLVHGIACVLENGQLTGEAYNLGSGIETPIEEAVNIFFSALSIKQKYYFNGKIREGDPLNWRADIGKIKELGFSPRYDLKKGLAELAQWFRSLHQ